MILMLEVCLRPKETRIIVQLINDKELRNLLAEKTQYI